MSRLTQGLAEPLPVRGYHPLWPDFPDGSGLILQATGLVRVRSPLLAEYLLISFPPATEMFHFTGFAPLRVPLTGGFPHSDIRGSKFVRNSPRLFAAYHVLHRLSTPRHSPNALKALDHSHYRCPCARRGRMIDGTDGKDQCFTRSVRTRRGHDANRTGLPPCGAHGTQTRAPCRTNLLFTMSGDQWPADPKIGGKLYSFGGLTLGSRSQLRSGQPTRIHDPDRHRRDVSRQDAWWSQTGSNRRPHACKARALPTELWPRYSNDRQMRGGPG